jgi:hypothetical protein
MPAQCDIINKLNTSIKWNIIFFKLQHYVVISCPDCMYTRYPISALSGELLISVADGTERAPPPPWDNEPHVSISG